jgi:hypothetical protein
LIDFHQRNTTLSMQDLDSAIEEMDGKTVRGPDRGPSFRIQARLRNLFLYGTGSFVLLFLYSRVWI